MLFLLFVLINIFSSVTCDKLITLTNNNFVSLRGPVTGTSIAGAIQNLLTITDTTRYIYLNTNGGSVDAGMKLINVIKNLEAQEIEVNCIADTAISMGFVIFQSCNKRYVTRYATLMQHQMSMQGISGKIYDINSYVVFTNAMEQELNIMQAEKIGMPINEFTGKITSDWWLTSKQAVVNGVADAVANIKCLVDNISETVTISHMFGDIILTYMKCPQIATPIQVSFDGNFTTELKDEIINNLFI